MSNFALDKEKLFPIDTPESIFQSIDNFDLCPNNKKNELAIKLYKACKDNDLGLNTASSFFKYISSTDNLAGRTLREDVFLYYENYINESSQPKLNKRQKIENLIYKVFNILDKTGLNTNKYKDMFNSMSDKQFDKYIKDLITEEDNNFFLEILPNKNEPNLKDIKKASDFLNIPLEEYVYLRHDGHKDDPIRTMYKVPVIYIHIKRMQQMLSKKNTYSIDINKRNMKTNQVTGSSKIARFSDAEHYVMEAIGANEAIKEFLGPRADAASEKTDMYKNISMYGYSTLNNLTKNIEENQTINTIYQYLIGAGVYNDLIE